MKYDVTIGIPVFNMENQIEYSLNSALNQTYPSIEFLIVDDGCCDGTLNAIKQIVEIHPRGKDIRIFSHHVNLGVSASRNQIIKEAKGDFLFFMDSDDRISENAIELLMKSVRQYDAEIAFGSYEKIEIDGGHNVYQYPALKLLEKDSLASFAYRKYAGIQASACNYLVKTSILREHQLRFIDTNYWEDFVFTFDLVTFITKAVLLPDVTYSYICREDSLSHYQQRDNISKEEVMRNIKSIDYLKKTSSLLYNKVYFPNRCYNIMMTDFYIACNILKRKSDIQPVISKKEIKSIMKHPATWEQICKFNHLRLKNVLLYIVGKLPSSLCVTTIWCIGKLKKLI